MPTTQIRPGYWRMNPLLDLPRKPYAGMNKTRLWQMFTRTIRGRYETCCARISLTCVHWGETLSTRREKYLLGGGSRFAGLNFTCPILATILLGRNEFQQQQSHHRGKWQSRYRLPRNLISTKLAGSCRRWSQLNASTLQDWSKSEYSRTPAGR